LGDQVETLGAIVLALDRLFSFEIPGLL
jgi:hypothetical protein